MPKSILSFQSIFNMTSFVALGLWVSPLYADVTYQEKVSQKIPGMRENFGFMPQDLRSTVFVSGTMMAKLSSAMGLKILSITDFKNDRKYEVNFNTQEYIEINHLGMDPKWHSNLNREVDLSRCSMEAKYGSDFKMENRDCVELQLKISCLVNKASKANQADRLVSLFQNTLCSGAPAELIAIKKLETDAILKMASESKGSFNMYNAHPHFFLSKMSEAHQKRAEGKVAIKSVARFGEGSQAMVNTLEVVGGYSTTPIDKKYFTVPSGFKKVEHFTTKMPNFDLLLKSKGFRK